MKHTKIIFLVMIFSFMNYYPCTTGIITSKVSKDGRPILFKHRDSDYEQNKLMYFADGKYDYIGLVNSEDKLGKEVWGGSNSAGFAIINSASYNLKDPDDKTELKDMEGVLMKEALQVCASVDEFEKFLIKHKKPLGVEANFGVIDALGNAAYFECNNFSYKKYDANDSQTAPNGYLIRTNFSFSGREDKGYGYIRFQNADELLSSASKTNEISVKFILQNVSRSLKHSLTKVDLKKEYSADESENLFVPFEDFIPRNSSTSTILIQGVKTGEEPSLTTIWTLLGFPLATVAFPVWVASGKDLPNLLTSDGNNAAPLCDKSLQLKSRLFPIIRGSGYKYLNLAALINKQNKGILQKIILIENEIFEKAFIYQEEFRSKKSLNKNKAKEFYEWADKFISSEFQNKFKI
mgnify:CR=1 FL=1